MPFSLAKPIEHGVALIDMNSDNNPHEATSYPEMADVETSSDAYATRFRGRTGAWMLAVQERAVLSLLNEHVGPGARILDVGGGHGQLAIPLIREGYRVEVIGSAPSCSHRIEAYVASGECEFKVGNVIDLPYADGSFDALVSVRMLTHCDQWERLVSEMCRVSRGPVVTDYPTGQSLNAVAPALFSAKKKYEKNTREWRLFRHQEVANAFRKSDFVETGRRAQFFLPMVLHRVLKCRVLSACAEFVCRIFGLTRFWGTPVVIRMEPTVIEMKGKGKQS